MATFIAFLAIIPVAVSALIAGDFPQVIYKPSHKQVYLVYRNRIQILAISLGLWLVAFAIHRWVAPTSTIWLGLSLVIVVFSAMTAFFVVPFTMFTGVRNGRWVTSTEADSFLEPDTLMLTLAINDDARAVSIKWMNRIHFWEDTVGGEEVNLSFCPLSNTSVALKPMLGDEKLNLLVPTQLENNLVMYDTKTGSLIQQIDGKIREGKHKGESIEKFPSQIMSWSAWKALYPDTRVLYAAPSNPWQKFVMFLVNTIINRHKSGSRPFFPTIDNLDTRLPHTAEVIGLTADDSAKAFALDYVCDAGVINTEVGEDPIVIVCDKKQDTQFVFSRLYNGETLTFEATQNANTLQLRDNTGRVWQSNGKLSDADGQLTPMTYMSRAFWFTWANFHPNTELVVEQ